MGAQPGNHPIRISIWGSMDLYLLQRAVKAIQINHFQCDEEYRIIKSKVFTTLRNIKPFKGRRFYKLYLFDKKSPNMEIIHIYHITIVTTFILGFPFIFCLIQGTLKKIIKTIIYIRWTIYYTNIFYLHFCIKQHNIY